MTGGVITGAISAAVNTEYSSTPTANNILAANGEKMYLTTAKTTAGGKMLVSVIYERVSE